MKKNDKVKELNRSYQHRKSLAMNMAIALINHERIQSTKTKVKWLKPIVEKLITRARKAVVDGATPAQVLHHKREVMKLIKDRDAVVKLFGDLAQRFKERNGGYTRTYSLYNRESDNSEMAIIEFVERKEKVVIQEERQARAIQRLPKKKREKVVAQKQVAAEAKAKDKKKDKKKKED